MSTSYLNKNRIDAIIRVDKFTAKHNATDNLRAEFKRWGSSLSVLKPINNKPVGAITGDIDVQITNVGIPYLNKENIGKKVKLNKKSPTHLLNQVRFWSYFEIKFYFTLTSRICLKSPAKAQTPEKPKNKSVESGKPLKNSEKKKSSNNEQQQQLSKAEIQRTHMIETKNIKKIQRNQVIK